MDYRQMYIEYLAYSQNKRRGKEMKEMSRIINKIDKTMRKKKRNFVYLSVYHINSKKVILDALSKVDAWKCFDFEYNDGVFRYECLIKPTIQWTLRKED